MKQVKKNAVNGIKKRKKGTEEGEKFLENKNKKVRKNFVFLI